jgi:cytochrome P450
MSTEVTEEAVVEFSKLLTYEALGKLHYLHAALSETLRLYPAVPIVSSFAPCWRVECNDAGVV